MRQNGLALRYASAELRADEKIVLLATQSHPSQIAALRNIPGINQTSLALGQTTRLVVKGLQATAVNIQNIQEIRELTNDQGMQMVKVCVTFGLGGTNMTFELGRDATINDLAQAIVGKVQSLQGFGQTRYIFLINPNRGSYTYTPSEGISQLLRFSLMEELPLGIANA